MSARWPTAIPPGWEALTLAASSKKDSVLKTLSVAAFPLLLAGIAAAAQPPTSQARAYRQSPNPARAKSLERFAASHKDANGALAYLTLGVVAFEQNRFPDAVRYLTAAKSRLPALADYTGFYLASAEAANQDYSAAAQDAARVRNVALPSPFAASSVVLQARATALAGSGPEAVRLLRESTLDLPQPDAALAFATAYQAAHDLPHAVQYDQRVYFEYPDSPAAVRADAELLALRDTMHGDYPQPSPQAMIGRANKLLSLREYARAQAEFESLSRQLSGPERDQARVGVAAAQYSAGDVPAAYSRLRGLEISSSEANAERLYYIAECARKLNDEDQMMEAVGKLSKYPDSIWRYRALLAAANRFLVSNRPEKYVPLYKAAYESFPDQPTAPASHWRVAWAAYMHRARDTRDLLREHLRRYPGHPSSSAALYYLARLAEAEADYPAARAFYTRLAAQFPNYYYGILARRRMAQPAVTAAAASEKTIQFLRTIEFPPHRPAVPSEPDPQTSLRISRAGLLASAGLTDLAQSELRFGAGHGGQPYLLAMELARTGTTPHEQLHNMKSAAPDYLTMSLEDAPPAFWQFLFPLPYRKDLVRSALKQNLAS